MDAIDTQMQAFFTATEAPASDWTFVLKVIERAEQRRQRFQIAVFLIAAGLLAVSLVWLAPLASHIDLAAARGLALVAGIIALAAFLPDIERGLAEIRLR